MSSPKYVDDLDLKAELKLAKKQARAESLDQLKMADDDAGEDKLAKCGAGDKFAVSKGAAPDKFFDK